MDNSRKEFLRTVGSFALFSSLGLTYASCSGSSTGSEPDEPVSMDGLTIDGLQLTVDLSHPNFQALQQEGGMVISTLGGFLAVNIDGEVIRVFTNICTHSRCTDQWSTSSMGFTCNCHGSKFDTSGSPTQGPAQQDLREFSSQKNGLTLEIDKTA